MNTKKNNAKSSIRFRRWSRAGYAVFCSLACTVTIGCLAVCISDKSLEKDNGISNITSAVTTSYKEGADRSPDILELIASLQNIQEISFIETTSDNTTACYQVKYIYIIHQNG